MRAKREGAGKKRVLKSRVYKKKTKEKTQITGKTMFVSFWPIEIKQKIL